MIVFCGYLSYSQLTCPTLTTPMNGDINVPVDAPISWNAVVGAPSYLISIGTTPNGNDIINNLNVGNATTYQPPFGLPDDTDIFVTLTIFFFNQENIICTTEMFRTEDVTEPPGCTTPDFPFDNAMNVNIGSSITWNFAPTATGYLLSLGSSAGGTDILNNETIIGAPFFQPPNDLPLDTEIFVTITPFNENGTAVATCPEFSFITGALAIIPNCTSLINPVNGAVNVELSPILEWTDIPDAIGYRVTIGTTPFNANVLNNAVFTTNSTLILDFEANLTFFVTIIPFNAAGDAIGCQQDSFSTILGCGPFFDSATNQLVDLRPEINFPNLFTFCQNDGDLTVVSEDIAEGFRWFMLDQNDNEQLLSTEREVVISEPGRYRLEAFNTIMQSGNTIECEISKIFEVIASDIATINSLDVIGQNGTIDVSVQASGIGDYEFAVDNIDGPYQDSNVFQNLETGFHTFYVRDKNGCGIIEETLQQDLTLDGFPKFFTPNGDGINDFWQFIQPPELNEIQVGIIAIFDRFGTLLLQIEPTSRGWDGTFNGRPLPSSDYWFQAISIENKNIRGHFTLKR